MTVEHAPRESLAPPDFRQRRQRLAERIDGLDLQATAYLLTRPTDVRYFTGFPGSNAVLIVDREGHALLGTDARYAAEARGIGDAQPDVDVLLDRATLATCAEQVARRGHARIVAPESSTIAEAATLASFDIDLLPGANLAAELRSSKDAGEVATIRKACLITAEALEHVTEEITPGVTELWVARRIEQLFGELGAEDRAFASIVATGHHSALPHHGPSATPLSVGDLLVIDIGARVEGYCADMTRTFVVGREPAAWQAEIAAVVEAAQRAGRESCRAGVTGREVDAAARSVIEQSGFGDFFGHGTGHGIGLDVHEAPMMSARSVDSMSCATALTVEPGIYLPGRGGVRIEDTLVTAVDSAEILTVAPHGLRVVG